MNPEHTQPLIAVITGVTRGLGRAMVDEFARRGHTVLGCARTTDEIVQLRDMYPRDNCRFVDVTVVDVTSDRAVKEWAERLLSEYGPPDLVLNNAGVLNPRLPLWEVSDAEFSSVMDTNVKGVVNVIRHFAPPMINRRRGVIVNFVSRWAQNVEARMAPYCATKWGVAALTKALAEELRANNIAAVALNPGTVNTGMFRKYTGGAAPTDTSVYPSAREWAKIAVPLILRLSIIDTGTLCCVPPFKDDNGP